MKTFLASFICLYSILSWGYCNYGEKIDLRISDKEIMKHLPIMNQESYNLCYAYASAFLLDFYRMKNNPKELNQPFRSSPLELAIMSEFDAFAGGVVCNTINSVVKRGHSCSNSSVSNMAGYEKLEDVFFAIQVQLMNGIDGKEPRLRDTTSVEGAKLFPALTDQKLKSKTGWSKSEKSYYDFITKVYKAHFVKVDEIGFSSKTLPSADSFYGIVRDTIKKVNEKVWGTFVPGLLQVYTNNQCRGYTRPTPAIKCTTEESGAYKNLIDDVDYDIGAQKPVGIAMCPDVFNNKKYEGMSNGKASCRQLHAVVIIGRKSDSNNHCHYLIRNSYGSNYKNVWPNENGDFWISEEALTKNLKSVYNIH
jgi:hypothetical protein